MTRTMANDNDIDNDDSDIISEFEGVLAYCLRSKLIF